MNTAPLPPSPRPPRKPVIGLAGRIGAGKSTVAGLLAELGAAVISSDELNRAVLAEPVVIEQVRQGIGPGMVGFDGQVDRRALAAAVFAPGADVLRQRLEAITHPRIAARRERLIAAAQADPAVPLIVTDAPLLFEAGLDRQCDAVLFVDAPAEQCRERVARTRGWAAGELERREKMQWPVDKKRAASDYVIRNDASLEACRTAVQAVFSRLIAHA